MFSILEKYNFTHHLSVPPSWLNDPVGMEKGRYTASTGPIPTMCWHINMNDIGSNEYLCDIVVKTFDFHIAATSHGL